jgi:hypothetical protein
MATAKQALQGINKWGAGFYEDTDLLIAALKLNDDEKYGFKANVFQIGIQTITGHKEGDNYYAVAALSGGDLGTTLNIGYREEISGKYEENKTTTQANEKKWLLGMCQSVILATGIDSLSVIAQVASELSIVMIPMATNDSFRFQTIKMAEGEKAEAIDKLATLSAAWIVNYAENPKKPLAATDTHTEKELKAIAGWLNDKGLFFVPLVDIKDHPVLISENMLTDDVKYYLPPIVNPLETCPHGGLIIKMPEMKAGKSGGNYSKGETTADKINARVAFIKKELGLEADSTLTDVLKRTQQNKESQQYFDFLLQVIGS